MTDIPLEVLQRVGREKEKCNTCVYRVEIRETTVRCAVCESCGPVDYIKGSCPLGKFPSPGPLELPKGAVRIGIEVVVPNDQTRRTAIIIDVLKLHPKLERIGPHSWRVKDEYR